MRFKSDFIPKSTKKNRSGLPHNAFVNRDQIGVRARARVRDGEKNREGCLI